MNAYKAVVTKKDVRAFTDQPIDDESLRKILQGGRMAGSAKATEPCRFVVIKDEDTKKRLAATGAYAGWIVNAPVVLAVVLEGGRQFDAGRAVQNMLIVANSLEIGSCPVTVGEEAGIVLGVPETHAVAAVIAFGHEAPGAAESSRRKQPRRPFEEYVHWERWGG